MSADNRCEAKVDLKFNPDLTPEDIAAKISKFTFETGLPAVMRDLKPGVGAIVGVGCTYVKYGERCIGICAADAFESAGFPKIAQDIRKECLKQNSSHTASPSK